jgi:hypothetical protein
MSIRLLIAMPGSSRTYEQSLLHGYGHCSSVQEHRGRDDGVLAVNFLPVEMIDAGAGQQHQDSQTPGLVISAGRRWCLS